MRIIGYRHQRTLAWPAGVEGVGLVTGARVSLRFRPAAADSGVSFRRTDRPGSPTVPARVESVTGTERRTTLGHPDHGVTLVEHVLAALAGLRIDNCEVEIDGPEAPGLDGSANEFVRALTDAGVVLQTARRPIWGVSEPVVVGAGEATIGLHPAPDAGLKVSYLLDYGFGAPIPPQGFTLEVRPENFVREVSSCRTFLLEHEAHALRSLGVGRHLTTTDVVVFGRTGPIENKLRFADEPARHKVLDLIGDLSLCGFDLAGHIVACRSGHALNVELARRVASLAAEAVCPAPLPRRLAGPRAACATRHQIEPRHTDCAAP